MNNDIKIGLTLSSEEHPPQKLIETAEMAENAGFNFVGISDHFHPWISSQGQSSFVWSVLGGISQVTEEIEVFLGVTCPIIRIHPVILAQAAASVGMLMEDRFIFGVGTGENLNEHILGTGWPTIEIRREMLVESVNIIRALWEGDYTSVIGDFYTVEDTKLFSLPKRLPPIIISAFGPISTKMAAEHGDGFVTTGPSNELVNLYTSAEGSKPIYGQMNICYGEDVEKCKEIVHKVWPLGGFEGQLNTELRLPVYFEQLSQMVSKEDAVKNIPTGPDVQSIIDSIEQYKDSGFTHIYIHQIGENQKEFIDIAKQKILPKYK